MRVNDTEMFKYVKEVLLKSEYKISSDKINKDLINYNRFDHIKRVYYWVLRLYQGLKDDYKINIDALKIASIFHDCGYGINVDRSKHALDSAKICNQYLSNQGFKENEIDFICYLISNHSNKYMLSEKDTPIELIILMEADLLDDTGAHGIIMDALVEAKQKDASFKDVYHHIVKYTKKTIDTNPMRTIVAQKIWEDKRKLVDEFIRQYALDLAIDEE